MKISYRQRIFVFFLAIFIVFTGCIIIVEQRQERKYCTLVLESRLNGYAEVIDTYIRSHKLCCDSISKLPELYGLLPDSVRLSIIGKDGRVLLDNEVLNVGTLDNHLDRPEIVEASSSSSSRGTAIRESRSTSNKYLYHARKFDNRYYVRVALPYNIQLRNMLKAESIFIYITVGLFIVVLLLLNYIAGRFGKSISRLKEFASVIKKDQPVSEPVAFPKDELGDIGNELIEIFNQREVSKRLVETEREKLIRHFRFSGEGLCIFSSDMKKIYANTCFIQYINLISDRPTLEAANILDDTMFAPVFEFINAPRGDSNHADFLIRKNAKTFTVQAIVFGDGSFEIIIKDATKAEKTRLLKQEMTSNIAHELRTPVTSLRGYLETLAIQSLPADRQKQFIERAYIQALRLSNLIEDASIISKIEEAPAQFSMEPLNIAELIDEVRSDLADKLSANSISFVCSVNDSVSVQGNYTLLYSVFRNLIDNSISYAGANIEININNYSEDDNYLYFSFYDTGFGVEERHLNRLFERFYRVNEGRTRDTGGSGLGLSIVKNAILLHKGNIEVKNRAGGGLEFLFTLKK